MLFFERFLSLMNALNARRVDYMVVGGVAMNMHGFARATEDIDLFLAPDEANVARLKLALQDIWQDEDIATITAEDVLGDYPVLRYGPPEDDVYIDIIFRLGEEVSYSDLDSQCLNVKGIEVKVATPKTLFDMKRNTLRAIDHEDARRLAAAFHFS